jgi:hypothetical protein
MTTERKIDNVEAEIRAELYRALEYLGADRKLLAAVGSWGDTLEDTKVLELLKRWNDVRLLRDES